MINKNIAKKSSCYTRELCSQLKKKKKKKERLETLCHVNKYSIP